MSNKLFLFCMTMGAGVLLTGCHMKHEWKEAACTDPRTCIVGNETEGEPLGHVWLEATCKAPRTCEVCGETTGEPVAHTWEEADCATPRTCAVCGETDGDALGHTWQEADYQNPETCMVCGETRGEPLTSSFEEHGLSVNARLGETYDYVTACAADHSMTTVAKLTFSDYREFETKLEAGEGYEWRAVHIKIEFSDDNAQNYGMGVRYSYENYYDAEAWREVYDVEDNAKSYTIHFNGTDYTECKCMFSGPGYGEWIDGVKTWEADAFVVVPKGYDGMVICFRNAGAAWEEGMYIYDVADENTLFFQMKQDS